MTTDSLSRLRDHVGHVIEEGMLVVKPRSLGSSAALEIRTVREIKKGKIYLDDSNSPIIYPGRLLVINELKDRIDPKHY
jgi:hypothetical protein